MKYSKLLLGLALCFFMACDDSASNTGGSSGSSTTPPPQSSSSGLETDPATEGEKTTLSPTTEAPEKHNCKIHGQLLEDNECYFREAQTLVCILADSTTRDMDFGESHRILEVYDTKTCERVAREELPVNYSPDFPYYLNTKTYEPKNKIICTQGYEYTFCFDVENKKMLPRLEGRFLSDREAEDAQSGAPQGLAVWEKYLFSYAQEYGACAFDLKDKSAIKPLLPVAEFELPEREFEYNSLFLLKQGNDRYQALVPVLDEEEVNLVLKPLFKKARKIDPNLSKNVRNNRFLVFNDLETSPIKRLAIDMEKVELVDLPTDMEGKKSGEILKWLKAKR